MKNYATISQPPSDIRARSEYHTNSSETSFLMGPKRKSLYTRWQSLAGIALFVSVVGTTYAYGIFSALLKYYLGYDQDQLDLIASIGNNGLYLSLVAGFLIERLGFKRVIRIGGIFIFIGFFYIWLAVNEYISSSQVSISFFYFLSQLGVCFHMASAIAVAVRLFPHTAHGGAIGLTKGYFGISTAVLGDIAGGVFSSNPTGFLLFVAIVIPIVGFYGSSQANILPPHLVDLSYEQRKGMYASLDPFIIHWAILFLTLTLVGYIEYAYPLQLWQNIVSCLLIFLVVISILWVPHVYGDTQIPVDECIPAGSNTISKTLKNEDDQPYFYEATPREQFPPELMEAQRRKYLFSEYLNLPPQSSSSTSSSTSASHLSTKSSLRKNSSSARESSYHDDDGNDNEGLEDSSSLQQHDDFLSPEEAEKQSLVAHSPASQLSSTKLMNNSSLHHSYKAVGSQGGHKFTLPFSSAANSHGSAVVLPDTCFYGENLPLVEAIKTWRLWSMFAHYLISTGVGLMVIYNVYSIAESVDQEPTTFFVTLIALANGLGRVVAGWMSDYSADAWNISKLLLLSIVVFSMAIVQFVLSFGVAELLFPGLLLVGFLFGCNVSLTAINIADIFGEKHIATNFGFVDAAPIFGSYLYATWLVTSFYTTNSSTGNDENSESICSGANCFRYPFLINSISCFIGFGIILNLNKHTPR